MKNFFIPVLLLSLGILSCQKEIDFGTGNNGGGNGSNNGGLFVKMVARSGTDSTVSNLGYNSSKKLISMTSNGVAGGMPFDLRQTFTRNGQGIITQIITKSSDFSQLGVDSAISRVNYNSASGRYTSRITEYSFLGLTIKDSVVFVYDANGKVVTEEQFIDQGFGSGYEKMTKNEYTYRGNNIATIKSSTYDMSTSSYEVQYTQTLTYDTKAAPLILGNEAFAIGGPNWYSSNNTTKSVIVVPNNPSGNEIQDVTYVYNSFNKPVSAISVVQGGPTANLAFTYN